MSAATWDNAVLDMHGWCQRQVQVPTDCSNAARLGVVLEDQEGDVGIVIKSLENSPDSVPLSGIVIGDRVTHVNKIRVRKREDLLNVINNELLLGDMNGVVLTLVRKYENDEEHQRTNNLIEEPKDDNDENPAETTAIEEDDEDASADDNDDDEDEEENDDEDDKGEEVAEKIDTDHGSKDEQIKSTDYGDSVSPITSKEVDADVAQSDVGELYLAPSADAVLTGRASSFELPQETTLSSEDEDKDNKEVRDEDAEQLRSDEGSLSYSSDDAAKSDNEEEEEKSKSSMDLLSFYGLAKPEQDGKEDRDDGVDMAVLSDADTSLLEGTTPAAVMVEGEVGDDDGLLVYKGEKEESRAEAAARRLAERQNAYQEALYGEVPEFITPLGMAKEAKKEEEEEVTQHLQHLIPLMNKIQDVFTTLSSNKATQGGKNGQQSIALDLPQIVVIGAQSSGKSSVIESLVGREFLPRGSGIVTRRPLIMQLVHTPGAREWAEFLHLPGRKFGSYTSIRDEISRATDELCGRSKAIAPQPISMRLFSPTVTNLTLVDLPGMTKVAVGDQPPDIETLIRNLTIKYVTSKQSLILAVIPATEDVANCEALALAHRVDPHRKRTLGVITKVDLMDDGTDCVPILSNRLIPLKLGYVAVVNRGELANQRGDSVTSGAARERAFFSQHPKYRSFLSRCTATHLAGILNSALVRHIHSALPDLKQRIGDEIYDVERELSELGDPVDELPAHRRGKLLLTLISDYAATFTGAVNGTPSSAMPSAFNKGGYQWEDGKYQRSPESEDAVESTDLTGGARISYILDDLFCATMRQVDPFDNVSDAEVCMAISNCNGHQPSLFVPEASFHLLVKKQIARLEFPSLETVDVVRVEMTRLAQQCAANGPLSRFPALHDKVVDAVSNLLDNGRRSGKEMVSNLLKVELAWLNTAHPNFIGGSRAVLQAMQRLQEEREKERERQALIRARTLGVFGNPDKVDSVLEGNAQGYAPPAENSAPPLRRRGSWRFWKKKKSSENTGEGSDEDDEEDDYDDEEDDDDGEGGRLSYRDTRRVTTGRYGSEKDANCVKLPPMPDTVQRDYAIKNEKETIEVETVKKLVFSYFNVVRKQMIDYVPKTVMAFLVKGILDDLQGELVAKLYSDGTVNEMTCEDPRTADRRALLRANRVAFMGALDILNDVRTMG